jgi:hypothetical protein
LSLDRLLIGKKEFHGKKLEFINESESGTWGFAMGADSKTSNDMKKAVQNERR